MPVLHRPGDLDWDSLLAVVYDGASLALAPALLASVAQGRARFERLIDTGVPCYGVTTGLGHFADRAVAADTGGEFVHNLLTARAAATGTPLPAAVARATLVFKLVNLLSGLDGVRPALCEFLVARLNDGFVPWIPGLGHGMAGDATAHTHAFQTFIGEGYVMDGEGTRMGAAAALSARGSDPFEPDRKEALALVNGVAAAPAYALHAWRGLDELLRLANTVAAVSTDAAAAPRDACRPEVAEVADSPGITQVAAHLDRMLQGSRIVPHKLQAPISFRVVAQVHGALADALTGLRGCLQRALRAFSGNPLLCAENGGDGFLSVGLFHDQHLVNQVELVAVALAHLGCLSERRLHRLLDAGVTGLTPQLAPRPGLDAGMVVAHKACIDLCARLRQHAAPLSLHTGDTSGGQEDYMSLAILCIARLFDMSELVERVLGYELLAALAALDRRSAASGGGVAAVYDLCRKRIPALTRDRAPGPDLESLLEVFGTEDWRALRDR